MPVHTAGDRPLVIYRLGSLGDTIVALPALHAIARAFPHALTVPEVLAALARVLDQRSTIHG